MSSSKITQNKIFLQIVIISILDSIVVSILACHAGDWGSIPRRGDVLNLHSFYIQLTNSKLGISLYRGR